MAPNAMKMEVNCKMLDDIPQVRVYESCQEFQYHDAELAVRSYAQ